MRIISCFKDINRLFVAKFISLFALMMFCAIPSLSAQSRTVSGSVHTESKTPLIGASVVVDGTSIGTTTNQKGEFKITVPADKDKLRVMFIGYVTAEITLAAGKTEYSVILAEEMSEMDEVVVVGYGNLKKSDLTSAVGKVDINSTEASTASSFQSLLQGRVAGVQVNSQDGAPGAAMQVRIRGRSSLTGSSEPLYVVDGIIMNATGSEVAVGDGYLAGSSSMTSQNGFTGINPQDIASVEILKDASATAIYGSLGANGVVMITTKQGVSSKPSVSYTGSFGLSEMSKKIRVLNLDEYTEYMSSPLYRNTTFSKGDKVYADWQDIVTQTPFSQNNRVSISQKTDKTNYYISGGFMRNEGIVRTSMQEQADIRINVDQELSKGVKIGTKSTFMFSRINMASGGNSLAQVNSGLIRSMLAYEPYFTESDVPSGEISNNDDDLATLYGPNSWLNDYRDYSKDFRIIASVYADIRLYKELSMKTTFGVDQRNKVRQYWFGPGTPAGENVGGKATAGEMRQWRWNFDHMFNYAKRFGNHNINATAGITAISSQEQGSIMAGNRFDNTAYKEEGLMYAKERQRITYWESLQNSFSFLARANYSFANKYVFTGTVRTDGSSKFYGKNKYATFPSAAFAYRMDQENFMKNLDAVSNLKIRLGWGMVGNQGVSPYQTLPVYSSDAYADSSGGLMTTVSPGGLPNPNLKWETTRQWNVGVDVGLFNNRVNLNVDAYDKRTKDLLILLTIPLSSGIGDNARQWSNMGSLQNRGIEITADFTPVRTKNSTLVIGGNFTINRNKVLSLGLDRATIGSLENVVGYMGGTPATAYLGQPVNIFLEGYPAGMFFGKLVDGILQEEDFVNGKVPKFFTGTGTYDLRPGDYKFVDVNDDGVIDSDDDTIIGNPNPKFTYGFTIDYTWKNLSISAVFTGRYGSQTINGNFLMLEDTGFSQSPTVVNAGTGKNVTYDLFSQTWREGYPSTTKPRMAPYRILTELYSPFIENSSYFRCQNLQLGYRLNFKNKTYVKAIALSLSVRNLFVITPYRGYDPDATSFANNPSIIGVDWVSYPASRTYSFGVNIDF